MKKNMKNNAGSKADGVKKQRKVRKARPDAKDAIKAEKAMLKDISARGKKMFLTNRKTVSALKKLTKNLAKLITEANQTGDQKLVGRITKLFGYLGFDTDSDANKVSWCFDAKVKPMKATKVKPEKKPDEKKPVEEKVRKPRKPRAEKKLPEQPVNNDIPPAEAEPSAEELEKLNNEKPHEVLVGGSTDLANVEEAGSVDDESDDESDDEDEQEPNEDDEDPESDGDDSEDEQEPQSYEDGLTDYRREAWGNGDFERDDI